MQSFTSRHFIRRKSSTLFATLLILSTSTADSQTVTPPVAKDNTLYEHETGMLSNGAGPHFFAGTILNGEIRRGLIAFDLSSIPPEAVVTGAALALRMDRTREGTAEVSLHRATSDWGEGDSIADGGAGGGGAGGASSSGDATWIHTFFDTSMWNSTGGDFEASASATEIIDGPGVYIWSGPGLVADLQSWITTPASNYGWVVIGDEAASGTAKRFNSREGKTPPELMVQYTTMPTIFVDGFETGTCTWTSTNPPPCS